MAAHPSISHSVSSLLHPLPSHLFRSHTHTHTYLPVSEPNPNMVSFSYTNSSSSQSQSQSQTLHAVQKPASKLPKKAASSSASAQPKVYNVKPIHFRELVQRLTGASQPQQAAQRLAPPPIQLATRPSMADHQRKSSASGGYSNTTEAFNLGDGTELSLSPNSWFSFSLLSPGPISNAHLS